MTSFSRSLLATALVTTLSFPVLAVMPDSGMWTIGQELNGKPGRGLQLDRQGGKTLIVTYFGYRPDGSSMFLQGSGTIKDGRIFSADLIEYKNGRTLGGAAQDGELAQVAGSLAITFDSTTSGTITLPGEAPQKISRFNFENLLTRLNHTFTYSAINYWGILPPEGSISISATETTFKMREIDSNGNSCDYLGDLVQAGKEFRSQGSLTCTNTQTPTRYRIEGLEVDEYGMLSARIYWLEQHQTARPENLRSYTGVCKTAGPVFLGIPRCQVYELGLEIADQLE